MFLDQDVFTRVNGTPDPVVVLLEVERWVDYGFHGIEALDNFLVIVRRTTELPYAEYFERQPLDISIWKMLSCTALKNSFLYHNIRDYFFFCVVKCF